MFPAEMVRYKSRSSKRPKEVGECWKWTGRLPTMTPPDLDDCEPSLPEHPWREGFSVFEARAESPQE